MGECKGNHFGIGNGKAKGAYCFLGFCVSVLGVVWGINSKVYKLFRITF